MKIADLKKNNDQSIYKQILETNEIDENCTLLREAIARDEAQCEDIKAEELSSSKWNLIQRQSAMSLVQWTSANESDSWDARLILNKSLQYS